VRCELPSRSCDFCEDRSVHKDGRSRQHMLTSIHSPEIEGWAQNSAVVSGLIALPYVALHDCIAVAPTAVQGIR